VQRIGITPGRCGRTQRQPRADVELLELDGALALRDGLHNHGSVSHSVAAEAKHELAAHLQLGLDRILEAQDSADGQRLNISGLQVDCVYVLSGHTYEVYEMDHARANTPTCL
jgi:hypothetical protein